MRDGWCYVLRRTNSDHESDFGQRGAGFRGGSMLRDESSPSYEELFGELDFRGDDDARSVYSPAAYLVDLLALLEGEFDHPSLLERRPDLEQVLLDADNTFT